MKLLCLAQNGLWGVAVTGTTRLGHIETDFFKAFRWVILYKFIYFGHFQAGLWSRSRKDFLPEESVSES